MRKLAAVAQLAVLWWWVVVAFGFAVFVVIDTIPR